MAQPTLSQVHIDAALTNASTAYQQSQDQFIATKVFPVVPVEKQSGKVFTYTKNDWFRDEAKVRADATESAGSGYGISTAAYSADVFALHKDIGEQARANADPGIDLERDATRFITQRMLLRMEIQWVTDLFTTGVWANDVTPSTLWSDQTGSDPINDMETAKEAILSVTGQEANTLVLGYQVYRQLKNNPDIIDRIKYTNSVDGRTVTPELLAAMFDVERVFVAKAVKATNVEGETAAYSFVHGKHALLLHVPDSPSLLTPSSGYTLVWRGVDYGMGTNNVGIKRMDVPLTNAVRVEGQIAFDFKVLGTDLGYFFNSAVA
jgi:hypothetical protein